MDEDGNNSIKSTKDCTVNMPRFRYIVNIQMMIAKEQ